MLKLLPLIFFLVRFPSCSCSIAEETQQTREQFLNIEDKLKKLAKVQKSLFGVKSSTKEDTVVAQDNNGNVLDIFAADTQSTRPEQLSYLFEGDIVLTDEQANAILQNAMNQMNQRKSGKGSRHKRSLVKNLSQRWTTFPIPYYINTNTGVEEKAVLNGVAKWEQETCLTFSRSMMYPNTVNALEFIRGSGCYSYIGKSGNRPQQVSIGIGCTSLGTVTHEIGHALGLYHEQSRFDRNDYVDIMIQNIQSSYLGQFSRQGLNVVTDYGVGYDYGSVMHYDQAAFNTRGRITIQTTDENYQQTIGQRTAPSFADVKRINFAYCNASCPAPLSCKNGGYTDPKNCMICRCPEGLGGALCDTVKASTEDCGQTTFATTAEAQVVKISGKKTCSYFVNAPVGMTITFQLGNMSFLNHNPCSEYIEIKYRDNLVQSGARFCKKYPTLSFTESNILLFIYKGDQPSSAVNIRFKTGSTIGSRTDYSVSTDDYYGDYYVDPPIDECSEWSPCSAQCGASFANCPQFYTAGANGNCYRYLRGAQTFKHAGQRCAQDGGHIASALNAFGNNIVHGMTTDPPSWLGLVCPTSSSSNCAWDDGTVYSSSSYQNFAASSGSSGANCVFIQNDGTWNFDKCDATKSFVCEVPDSGTADCYGYSKGSSLCYKAYYGLKTFNEGHSLCLQECAELAYISSQAENDRMIAGLCWECDNQNALAKIGLTLAGDVYSWTNGQPFNPNKDYSNFAFVKPSLGNCVAIAVADTTVSGKPVKRGQWVNVSCTQYGPFVCNRAPGQCNK